MAVAAAFGPNVSHIQSVGQSLHHDRIVGFGQGNDISLGISQNLIDRFETVGAAKIEVVRQDTEHGRILNGAGQIGKIITCKVTVTYGYKSA